jgi:hypothetical protein
MNPKLRFLLFLGFTGIIASTQAQWTTPLNISPGTTTVSTNENAGQCIAVVGDTVRVTYIDLSTTMAKVMYNQSYNRGITWRTPVEVFTSRNSFFPAIASNSSGVHIVWMDSLGSSRASFYKRSLDGGDTWGTTICLDSFTKFWPGIACSGNLVVATLNKDLSGNTEVFIKRSLNNGSTWMPIQQISHAPNRSEDPAINILGNHVHLSWNDKRSGVMNIYYCHSSDGGATWGAETGLTTVDSYTSMVCLNGNHVDVPHGIRPGTYFDVWNAESADTGATWKANQQYTNTPTVGEVYPFMVRDGMKMHCVYSAGGSANYIYSPDGGLTWATPLVLSPSSQPFIAYTECVLHVIFANGGHLNYMRNPTGNGICPSVGITNIIENKSTVEIYPNPCASQITLTFNELQRNSTIKIISISGKEVNTINFSGKQLMLETGTMNPGVYVIQIKDAANNIIYKKIMIQ